MSRPRSQSRVRFSPDHMGPTPRGRPATAPRDPNDFIPGSTRSYSPSRSPSQDRSRSHSRTRASFDSDNYRRSPSPPRHHRPPPRASSPSKKDKHFYQKKTLWSGLATIATVAALLPTAVSAKASVDAAHASTRAARASEKSAKQVTKSAKASQLSARAAASSSIAQGHMDEYGRVVKKDNGSGRYNGGPRAAITAGPGWGGRQARGYPVDGGRAVYGRAW